MFDHVPTHGADLAVSVTIYNAVLPPFGGVGTLDFGEVIGYGPARVPGFWIGMQSTGEGSRESHLALVAADRSVVGTFFLAASALSVQVFRGPKLWPEGHTDKGGKTVRDPNGDKVEAGYHTPRTRGCFETSWRTCICTVTDPSVDVIHNLFAGVAAPTGTLCSAREGEQ